MTRNVPETVVATNGANREVEEPPPAATKASPRGTGGAQAGKGPGTSPPRPVQPPPWILGWGGLDAAEGSGGEGGGGWGWNWGGGGGGGTSGSGDGVSRSLAEARTSPAQRRESARSRGEVAPGASPQKREGRGGGRGAVENAGKVERGGGAGLLPYAQTPVSARISREAATRESQLLRSYFTESVYKVVLQKSTPPQICQHFLCNY